MPQPADAREAERLIALSEMVSCHSFWRWHNVWLARVAKRHRLPYWFVPHGGLDPYVFSSGRLAKRMFIEAAKPFFDNADFHRCDPAARTAVRRGLGIPEEAFCLLSFGRLDPMKRPLETIDAVAEVGLPDVHLIVMGNESGVSIVECEQRADKRGLRGRVHVVGAKYGADKTAHLDAADAYISLSHRENFNFTAAECLAAGLPVILSPGNDLAGELAAVDCGVMLEAVSDAPGGIDRLSRIGMAQRERLGENGRRWAEANLRAAVFRERIRSHAAAVAARRG
jgi:glycosyltransferase involved in cell wall biosynthesis